MWGGFCTPGCTCWPAYWRSTECAVPIAARGLGRPPPRGIEEGRLGPFRQQPRMGADHVTVAVPRGDTDALDEIRSRLEDEHPDRPAPQSSSRARPNLVTRLGQQKRGSTHGPMTHPTGRGGGERGLSVRPAGRLPRPRARLSFRGGVGSPTACGTPRRPRLWAESHNDPHQAANRAEPRRVERSGWSCTADRRSRSNLCVNPPCAGRPPPRRPVSFRLGGRGGWAAGRWSDRALRLRRAGWSRLHRRPARQYRAHSSP